MAEMATLISLVGEQPIPILLPDRYFHPKTHLLVHTPMTEPVAKRLQRLLPASELLMLSGEHPGKTPVEVPAGYQFETAMTLIKKQISPHDEVIINLTGGTKMMAIGAFAAAAQRKASFVYLASEQKRSVLYQYRYDKQGVMDPATVTTLSALITIDEYLRAHLPGYSIAPPVQPTTEAEQIGYDYERVVGRALAGQVDEMLASVRPDGVAEQIEIDLVLRCGNQVAVAEVKVGGGEGPKKGIDQLATAAAREYLGTYTGRLLITASRQNPKISQLAKEKGIMLLTARCFGEQKIEPQDQKRLIAEIRTLLGATQDEGKKSAS